MRRSEVEAARERACEMLVRAGIVITAEERDDMEVIDLGLGEFERTGLMLVVYVNTDRYCAKELIMFPRQTCPEHGHPRVEADPGKMETFRCRWGKVFLYEEGEPAADPACKAPAGHEAHYTVWNEIELNPGEQYTLLPNRWHWFQSGPDGAVVSEFSTKSRDHLDEFTDPGVVRETTIEE